MSKLIQAKGIHKSYYTGAGELPVLQGVNLSLAEGDCVAILGESGSGKSTLLHILGLIDSADRGELTIDGDRVSLERTAKHDRLRNRFFGFVFQFYHLLPEFSAFENMIVPAIVSGEWKENKSGVTGRGEQLLSELGLAGRACHKPRQLSGGEQQRVAIARALINEPKVLLADEPTGNLDKKTSGAILDVLVEINRRRGTALVLVTHNTHVAEAASRTLELRDGILTGK